jgi:hypothetical protein
MSFVPTAPGLYCEAGRLDENLLLACQEGELISSINAAFVDASEWQCGMRTRFGSKRLQMMI